MGNKLEGKKIAILVEEGFEQVELTKPLQALKDEGAEAHIVSPNKNSQIKAWNHTEWGDKFTVDKKLSDVKAEDYNGLLLPGGVMNPDALRIDEEAVTFVRDFFKAGKPVAAICHAPWTLIEAEGVQGRTLTSWPSLRTDLTNAGAKWVDLEVVVDGNLITSRKPQDLPAFDREMVRLFAGALAHA